MAAKVLVENEALLDYMLFTTYFLSNLNPLKDAQSQTCYLLTSMDVSGQWWCNASLIYLPKQELEKVRKRFRTSFYMIHVSHQTKGWGETHMQALFVGRSPLATEVIRSTCSFDIQCKTFCLVFSEKLNSRDGATWVVKFPNKIPPTAGKLSSPPSAQNLGGAFNALHSF